MELPTDHARPAVRSHRGRSSGNAVVTEEVTEKLKEVGRREGVTLFMRLLAVFQVVLASMRGRRM